MQLNPKIFELNQKKCSKAYSNFPFEEWVTTQKLFVVKIIFREK